jgi:diguanylate cyclase (GGDEF)-like protein
LRRSRYPQFGSIIAAAWSLLGCHANVRSTSVRVGADEAPPFVSLAENGVPRGLAVDILNEAARREGVTLFWVVVKGMTPDEALDRNIVDIWPILGVTDIRQTRLHLTKPWFQNEFCLFSREGDPVDSIEQSANRKIAYADYPLAGGLARQHFPKSAQLMRVASNAAVIDTFCKGQVAAGFLEARTLEGTLLNRPVACRDVALHVRLLPSLVGYGSIASKPAAAPVADALYRETLQLVRDGTFSAAVNRWSSFSAGQVRSLLALQQAQTRDQIFFLGSGALAAALVILSFLLHSAYRARASAERSRQAAVKRNDILGRLVQGESWQDLLRALDDLIRHSLPDTRCEIVLHPGDQQIHGPKNGPKNRASLPITSRDGVELGRIEIANRRVMRKRGTREILQGLLDLVAVVVEHRRILDMLEYQARHDRLTGLLNRTTFAEILELNIRNATAETPSPEVAVLFLDLDGFKYINDGFGHRLGDLYLKEAARRVSSCLEADDVAARAGGDEFTLMLTRNAAARREEVAARILRAFGEPFALDGYEIFGTVSIGVSSFPADGTTGPELQISADSALYAAKEAGRNQFCTYSPAMRAESQKRVEMQQLVRLAIERNWLHLYYQPKFRVTGEFAGFEALVRIIGPEGRIVAPEEFITAAEHAGLITQIDSWVLDQACRQFAAWNAQGLDPVQIAINLSRIDLARTDIVGQVRSALSRWGLSSRVLQIELTESTAMGGGFSSLLALKRLQEFGVSLALDDFGTGHSSLSCLRGLPVDTLKIDKSFVSQLDTDSRSVPLIEAIVAVARVLGISVVAEGIENWSQVKALRSLGCDMLQGYYFSIPMDVDAATDYLIGVRGHAAGRLHGRLELLQTA